MQRKIEFHLCEYVLELLQINFARAPAGNVLLRSVGCVAEVRIRFCNYNVL